MEQFLGESHPVGVIMKRHVRFHGGKLIIVLAVEPLIPEHLPQLEHAVEPAHDELFERQFGADSQRQVAILALTARDERRGHRAARQAAQDGRLDVQEAFGGEEGADELDDLGWKRGNGVLWSECRRRGACAG